MILHYFTLNGYVNTGFINKQGPFPLALPTRESVIIIGAGTAGLAAAHHLRKFGYQVSTVSKLCIVLR